MQLRTMQHVTQWVKWYYQLREIHMAKTSLQLRVTLYIYFLSHSVIFHLGQGFRMGNSWDKLSVIIHKHNDNEC